jgi:hypothetical protein
MFDIDISADVNEKSRAKIHFASSRATNARRATQPARRLLRAAERARAARSDARTLTRTICRFGAMRCSDRKREVFFRRAMFFTPPLRKSNLRLFCSGFSSRAPVPSMRGGGA